MNRVDVLMEAMPYIQKFHGKTVVVKLGGHAMVDPDVLDTVIQDVVLLHYVGMKIVIVHGGGPEITNKMKAMGKEPKFVGGLRITDNETLEIAQMVLVGKINDGIVSLIAKFGAAGVGLSGNDGNLLIAKKMAMQKIMVNEIEEEVDLGHVGEIEEVNPEILERLLESGYIPVITPIAIDRKGLSLNVNADTAAGDIAIALNAYKFINMSDIDGVMNAQRTRIYHRLNYSEAMNLIKDGTIVGGMIPKLSACLKCLDNGVRHCHIINGNKDHNLLIELFTHDGIGTMIKKKS
ncbi:acetylglutamate kinase [Methanoplanus sp. FWC-SCC4]|uniref:Acetylglutamate kinase n=1 Tax=Methanochimaera problematica TaxID=2609417 RepID=A0AA97I2V9_9EURY|nr:acetylglutamate kinase [Methanoplanus sp. FWC-SCC4]WOF15236.1 acetylglutamate kinase [Methanoplanus sp. FWC-SCC4]